MSAPELSVIITCYFEEHSIDEFHGRLRETLQGTGRSFEILFVNDGSTDGTLEHLRQIHAEHDDVTVLDLYRNSGQVAAMTAAVERARGQAVLFMDSDLQLDPEEIPLLLAALDDGADVVSGKRVHRQDSLWRRLPSSVINRLLARLTRTPFTDFGCTFKGFRGDLVRAFEPGPHRLFNPVVAIRHASRFREVPVTHHARQYGRSGWTFRKLIDFAIENVIGTSRGLFQHVSLIALVIAGLTFVRIALAWTVPGSILAAQPTTGLLLNAALLSTALLLAVLCLVGEYMVRMYEGRVAPRYIVREVLEPRSREARAPWRNPWKA
jgi:dolichol-phosphate mannosyltransferase